MSSARPETKHRKYWRMTTGRSKKKKKTNENKENIMKPL